MSGERTALDLAQAGFEDENEPAEQLDLLGVPQTPELMLLRTQRGPGRPPGARNKRTERTVQFLLARHQDPREVLLAMAEARVDELTAALGCSAYQAWQEKRLAAIGVLPYVAQRQPLAVAFTGVRPIHLHMHGMEDANGVRDDDSIAARLVGMITDAQFVDVPPDDGSGEGQS